MTTTIFPREEHTQALFREILKDPAACERLMDTFCRSLNSDEDINESVSAKEFAEALFQAYTNQDLSAFLMIICKNTTFDLLRNAFLIPYRFDADGITNPVIMTDEHGELLPEFHRSEHEREYRRFQQAGGAYRRTADPGTSGFREEKRNRGRSLCRRMEHDDRNREKSAHVLCLLRSGHPDRSKQTLR